MDSAWSNRLTKAETCIVFVFSAICPKDMHRFSLTHRSLLYSFAPFMQLSLAFLYVFDYCFVFYRQAKIIEAV